MKRLTIARLVAGAFLAGTVAAGPALAADEFTESHIAAAREAVTTGNNVRPFDEILPVIAEQTSTVFIRTNPALATEITEVTNAVALDLANLRPELDRTIIEIWARRFTEAELKEIAAFYKSDVGAKLAKLRPDITALSIGAAKQWQDQLSTVMFTRVREELKKRGYTF